jgi:hypothetical protein
VVEQLGRASVRWFATDLFYRDGAVFNKGRALERGLEELGRFGWVAIVDADILLPRRFETGTVEPGCLYCPRRRIVRDLGQWTGETDWSCFPQVPDAEHAGYFQLFHCGDPVLSRTPWYGVHWKHAGRCDSDFQRRWAPEKRRWMPFEVLHLGEEAANWMGRCTPLLNGLLPPGADRRRRAMSALLAGVTGDGCSEMIRCVPGPDEGYLKGA